VHRARPPPATPARGPLERSFAPRAPVCSL